MGTSKRIVVRFWGVRGSYPVPGPTTARFGGNTPCVEIRVNHHLIILDAGTGIIPLGKKLVMESAESDRNGVIEALLLVSHTHHDHIQGLPFFMPAHAGKGKLYIFGPPGISGEFQDTLANAMLPPYSPLRLDEMRSVKVIRSLHESQAIVLEDGKPEPWVFNVYHEEQPQTKEHVLIRVMRSYSHPKGGTYIFRIEAGGKSVVFATDTEGYVGGDTRLIAFARGANLLIHDAQYTTDEYLDPAAPKQGYGHSTVDMAVQVAQQAGVDRLVLFHHDPDHDDATIERMESYARERYPHTDAAQEGKTYEL